MMDYTFEESAWEQALPGLKDSVSAVQFLALLEGEEEDVLEEAFETLIARKIRLDISELPKTAATAEAAVRLRREEQLVESGRLLLDLEESDPLRLYLEELARTPACGDPVLLSALAAEGDENARNLLVNLSLHRVVSIAQELVGNGVLLLDLIQEGGLGLWESILSWQGGCDFEDYRDWHIRQAMARLITLQARAQGVGQKMRQALEDYRSVDEKLLAELGRNPTQEEIARDLHMSLQETAVVASMLETARNMNRAKAEREPKEPEPEDEQAVEDTAYFQMRQRIQEMLSGLDEQAVKLLSLRFGLEGGAPMSPEETGQKLGMTPEEVVAAEAAALAKLRTQG